MASSISLITKKQLIGGKKNILSNTYSKKNNYIKTKEFISIA